jgi:hypothetical protein
MHINGSLSNNRWFNFPHEFCHFYFLDINKTMSNELYTLIFSKQNKI